MHQTLVHQGSNQAFATRTGMGLLSEDTLESRCHKATREQQKVSFYLASEKLAGLIGTRGAFSLLHDM
jgi:hypothetical protein